MAHTRWVVPLTATVALAALALGHAYAAGRSFVELSWPQSDDEGQYVGLAAPREMMVVGFVGMESGVRSVLVNGVEADLFAADYSPWSAPEGIGAIGFQAPLWVDTDEPLRVVVTSRYGDADETVFQPDRVRVVERLRRLSGRMADDPVFELRLANALAGSGDYDGAFPHFQAVIDQRPRFAYAPFFYGLALRDNENYDDAVALFQRSAVLQPGWYLPHYAIGRTYTFLGDPDGAEREFRVVVGLRPELAEAHWRLASVLGERDRWGEANDEYNRVIALRPESAEGFHAHAMILAHEGRDGDAVTYLQRAESLNPHLAEVHHGLGMVLTHEGRDDDAAREYRQAIQINPRLPEAHRDLANVLTREGKTDEATRELHQATPIQHQPTTVHVIRPEGEQGKPTSSAGEERRTPRVEPGQGSLGGEEHKAPAGEPKATGTAGDHKVTTPGAGAEQGQGQEHKAPAGEPKAAGTAGDHKVTTPGGNQPGAGDEHKGQTSGDNTPRGQGQERKPQNPEPDQPGPREHRGG